MNSTLLDLFFITAAIVPTLFFMLYFSANFLLKRKIKRLLSDSLNQIEEFQFSKETPQLTHLSIQKNPIGKWSLVMCYFFSYENKNKKITGQATMSNNTLVDIQFKKDVAKQYDGFINLSANDETLATRRQQIH